jgi:hypothetical protein
MNTIAGKSAALSTGKELVCFCSRCKLDLAHTIMSMLNGSPARVICRTCKSEHNYKPKRGISEVGAPGTTVRKIPSTRTASSSSAEKAVPIELEWMQQINASTAAKKEYAANVAFQVKDRILHPTFGEGIVQKLLYPNKIEILFKMDLKILIHAGKPA